MPLNDFLGDIPRARLFRFHANVPAYRACGVTGFFFAVLSVLAAGLLTGRALWVLLALSASAALSFLLLAHARRRLAGRECIVLLEHVWFALLVMAATLAALRQPVLPYLDATAPALAVFLAFGRLGCTFVGCCHGVPSTIGIVYPDHFTSEGFAGKFAGIRLFPVAALEMIALAAIAVTCFAALRLRPPGVALAWFLLSYAFVRYLLEAMRGDDRPHWLGLSVPRWMCAAQAGAVLAWLMLPAAAVAPGLIGFAVLRYRRDPMRRLLHTRHLAELRELASGQLSLPPVSKESSERVRVAASLAGYSGDLHVSLSGAGSLVAVCRVAAAAFPGLRPDSARLTTSGVLHFLAGPDGSARGEDLHLDLVRRLQAGDPQPTAPPAPWYFGRIAELSDDARI